jgi:hypothetical protein
MNTASLLLSVLALSLVSASAATYVISEQPGLIAPSTRGASNTTHYGWDTFNEPADRAVPINDNSPDLGTAVAGALFRTTNGEDHVLGSGNFYLFAGTPAEEVTAVSAGVLGTGFTSVILQGVTAFDPFPGAWTFDSVGGVTPTVVQGVNGAGFGQFWVKYDFPGNEANYVIPFNAGGPHYSIDRFTVDTVWNAGGFSPDFAMAVPEPAAAAGGLLALGALFFRRRR